MEFEKKPETSYLVRDEAEKVSRDKGIPPERFSEFAKSGWKDIITKFCYTFLDMKKTARKQPCLQLAEFQGRTCPQ